MLACSIQGHSQDVKPVSYTHLDVYKRQVIGPGVQYGHGPIHLFYKAQADHLVRKSHFRHGYLFVCRIIYPVSYTHLSYLYSI